MKYVIGFMAGAFALLLVIAYAGSIDEMEW